MQDPLFEQRRQSFKTLQAENPRLVKMTTNLLRIFVRNNNKIDPSRDPLAHFAQEEVVLHAQGIIVQIKKQLLTYVDFRDDAENLVGLQKFCLPRDPAVARTLGTLSKKFIDITSEMASSLEYIAEVPQTDWDEIATTMDEKVDRLGLEDNPPIGNFFPKMKDFRSTKLLGAGGFGAVYLCSYKPVEFICTVKLVSVDSFEQIKQACMDKVVTSVIRNPFLVKYYACFQCAEAFITIMEYIPGLDLMRVVTREGYLDAEANQIVTSQLILALEHMHLRGFIHRDVKVSNMLIMAGGRVKTIDFDTAKISQAHFSKRVLRTYFRRTAHEFVDCETAGTLPYMAPEMLKKAAYGRAVDWWSTGITFYKMATGRVPFRARSKQELRSKICTGDLKWPRPQNRPHSATIQAKDFTFRMLKKAPTERLGSKSYIELKLHTYFDYFDWDNLYNSRELCEIPSINVILGEDAKKKRITEPGDNRKFMEVNDMTDMSEDEQKRLLCMCSGSWKRLMTLVNESGLIEDENYEEGCVEIEEDFMDTEDNVSEPIDYQTAPLMLSQLQAQAETVATKLSGSNGCSIS